MMKFAACLILPAVLFCCGQRAATAQTNLWSLVYAPAPPDNPLKGFLPYAGSYTTFPYSVEWSYLPLRALMSGPTNFNWTALDVLLTGIAGRGHQTVFRIFLDYPGEPTGIPQYLLDGGLVTHSYTDYGNNGLSRSPDYEDPNLRQAMTNFIAALGDRYDGDPRIGFIEVGLLGFWGEWHTYPYPDWFGSVTVQDEVLAAYGNAFDKTKLLVRWPSGTNPSGRSLGYHDDSFAYQTIDPPDWMFLGRLRAAGETNRWRTQPIGGEVRPEVQSCMWSQPSCVPAGQEFTNCVELTHASWMLNHGAFSPGFTGGQLDSALAGARQLGYELYVATVQIMDPRLSGLLNVSLQIRNTGVAPFYYDWPVQLGVLSDSGTLGRIWTTPWTLSALLPSQTNTVWTYTQTNHGLDIGPHKLLLRVLNPLTNGMPLRFANHTQDADLAGWLTLGQFVVASNLTPPKLSCSRSSSGFELQVSGATPAVWTVERTSDFVTWVPLLTTNTSGTAWSITDTILAPARFYRVAGQP